MHYFWVCCWHNLGHPGFSVMLDLREMQICWQTWILKDFFTCCHFPFSEYLLPFPCPFVRYASSRRSIVSRCWELDGMRHRRPVIRLPIRIVIRTKKYLAKPVATLRSSRCCCCCCRWGLPSMRRLTSRLRTFTSCWWTTWLTPSCRGSMEDVGERWNF